MTTPPVPDPGWETLLTLLPPDLAPSAFQYGALYRKRGVRDAATLLRLIFAYASDLPLDAVAAWAHAQGLATLSDQALDQRLRQAGPWLAHLLATTLATHAGLTTPLPLRVRLADTTLVQRPGVTQPDWRGHLTLDLARQRLDAVTLTDHTHGEDFTTAQAQPGDLLLGDRAFGTRANVWRVARTGAWVLVRVALHQFPLQHPDGRPVAVLVEACRSLAPGETRAWPVQTVPTSTVPALSGRLVVTRLPEAQAAAARARVAKSRRHYGKQKGQLSADALEIAGYVVLWTTLPAALAEAETVAALYRLRWQIELAIKRYKQLAGLAHLTARHTALCRTVLLAKLLRLVLTEHLCATAEAFSP
jgi:hypothetical protein